jgi:uncharacterized protein YgbK (DUF1537 family)
LADLYTVRRGPAALRAFLDSCLADGVPYVITDAIEQHDLAVIAEATREWPLVTGGSGITAEIPAVHFSARRPLSFAERFGRYGKGVLAIAGSCSPATVGQVAFAARNGFRAFRLSGVDILNGTADVDGVADQAAAELTGGGRVLLTTSAEPREVGEVHEHCRRAGLSVGEAGGRIVAALAEVSARTMASGQAGTLIVSGGETAGAVCRRLGITAMAVGLPIEPGVPYCFPLDGPPVTVVLKSGNFGSEDFCLRALQCLSDSR